MYSLLLFINLIISHQCDHLCHEILQNMTFLFLAHQTINNKPFCVEGWGVRTSSCREMSTRWRCWTTSKVTRTTWTPCSEMTTESRCSSKKPKESRCRSQRMRESRSAQGMTKGCRCCSGMTKGRRSCSGIMTRRRKYYSNATYPAVKTWMYCTVQYSTVVKGTVSPDMDFLLLSIILNQDHLLFTIFHMTFKNLF